MRWGIVALAAVALLLLLPVPLTGSAQEGAQVTIRMPGERPLTNGIGQPVLVAGIWHELQVDLGPSMGETLELEATFLEASSKDMSTYYRWVRDEADDTWSDPEYEMFIDPGRSSSDGSRIAFLAGVDAAASPGSWRLQVSLDGEVVLVQEIEVQSGQIDYGLSAADFRFWAEPFQSVRLSSEPLGQYLRVRNSGNVPLQLSVTFDRLQDRLSLTNPATVAHIQEDARYFLALDLDPRPPQILDVRGVSRVEVLHRIPSPGATQLVPALEGTFQAQIVIGRSGYVVQSLGSVVFQTLERLEADYGATVTWQVYLTGDLPVVLDVEVKEARLAGVLLDGRSASLPVAVSLASETETPVTVQIRAEIPDVTAEVFFTLRIPDTGEVQTYRTTISVGPRPAMSTALPPSYLWLVASFVVASVLALVSYNQWRWETGRARPFVSNGTDRTARKRKESEKGRGGGSRKQTKERSHGGGSSRDGRRSQTRKSP